MGKVKVSTNTLELFLCKMLYDPKLLFRIITIKTINDYMLGVQKKSMRTRVTLRGFRREVGQKN